MQPVPHTHIQLRQTHIQALLTIPVPVEPQAPIRVGRRQMQGRYRATIKRYSIPNKNENVGLILPYPLVGHVKNLLNDCWLYRLSSRFLG